MDELIRKQDALDALMAERKHLLDKGQKGAEHILTHHGYNVIDELPPVQSDVPDMNAGDMISRRDAIDALDGELEITGRTNAEAVKGYVRLVKDRLERLPSAQPERTCVSCGRTVNNGGWYADGRTRCPIEEHYALPKDGFCHLWEKRNVTDDDYPERRTDDRSD